ncbi:MAG: hypothetical protein J7L23_03360 [Candidatus Diapherotrites archaeon]|nr:hypothetical protein [Candidatus Diapherotrites archaeon]
MLSGIWDEKEVAYYENPEKRILIVIYDKKGDEIAGVVTLMAKFFLVEGNATELAYSLDNTILIQKRTPLFKGSFIGVVTDPTYIEYTPRNLINETAELYNKLDERNAEIMRKTGDYNISLISLEFAGDKTKELFGEPLALPAMVVRKPGPKTVMETPVGNVVLGIDLKGETVKEDMKSFAVTIISGDKTRLITHLIVEGFILNGTPSLIFDGKNEFTHLDEPNRQATDLQSYDPELEPLSLPLRRFVPGSDVFVNLDSLNEKLFANIAGIKQGKETELVSEVLSKKDIKSLGELATKLEEFTSEDDKYYAARAIRICKLLDETYPGVFNGAVEPNELLAPWMKRIGRVALIDLSGIDKRIAKGIIYSVLTILYKKLKEESSGDETRIVVALEDRGGDGEYIDKETNALIKLCSSYGMGICLRTPSESNVDTDLFTNATARVKCINEKEVSVHLQTKNPYRVKLRPPLSAE